MMDLSIKGSGSEDLITEKRCSDCQATKTPLWRGGPAGPKSLCNACGIRQRKKRSALLGLNSNNGSSKKLAGKIERKERSSCSSSGSSSSSTSSDGIDNNKNKNKSKNKSKNKIGVSLKLRFLSLGGREVLLQQRSKSMEKQRKLGEEEQAAVLLMALSCGSLYV
ncbi:hypothetical protein MKX01_028929 [Papaver californicum]|nr:hypothetical protein MKX01_028929 [Papaver californicum]